MSLHLDPVFRVIIQVLGVDIDLLEESPSGFYLSQVVFSGCVPSCRYEVRGLKGLV